MELTQQLLRGYEAHLRFFDIQEEEEIFNLLAIRDELLKMELSGKEREEFDRLEAKLMKLLPQIERKYPILFKAFVRGEKVEPQGRFWKI